MTESFHVHEPALTMNEQPIGPPLPVEGVTVDDDGGWCVSFTVPRDHPAYAVLTAGIIDGIFVDADAGTWPLPSVHGKIPEV